MKRGTLPSSEESRCKKSRTNVAVKSTVLAVTAAVSLFHNSTAVNASSSVALACSNMIEHRDRKPNGRYLRRGSLPTPAHSFWVRILLFGDDMEFFHFLSLSRSSFNSLCRLTETTINTSPLNCDEGRPRPCDLKRRMFGAKDIMAITIKYLLSKAEVKDLQVQFGATNTHYMQCVEVGMAAICRNMIDHPQSRVFWDRSKEGLEASAKRTWMFAEIPGVVGMIDGKKLETLHPSDHLEQNRDYNGWHSSVNRNLILMWDPNGKIIDAGVNLPGNFHDSKSTLWCNIYDHIIGLPEGYVVVCDSAFNTGGLLKTKLVKLKEEKHDENRTKTEYEKSLTHLRQCSEWGNNVLTGAFRRLKTSLPTDNLKRATIQWCCILLHNWQTETCDQNQIKTYFENLEADLVL
jgi:hypothetical protein